MVEKQANAKSTDVDRLSDLCIYTGDDEIIGTTKKIP